ncbi:MAG TPA: LamG-like jellyroll fold domain-containing protein, partial [Candidatus Sulfotelmatobacter sp.]|nr:LamG-like jellyroll fold domain-containing protein [Candidatus Sulfotelmatobacter sp.]
MNTRKKLKTIGLSLAGLTLSLTAAVAAPIGVNWVNNGNGNTQNGSADSMVATDIAGAPGLEQGNWNNLGRWGNSINLVDGNGVATGVLINWDATGVWNNGASTSDPNGKMMNGYLDSNGSANTALGGPRVYDAGNNNKPVIYVDSGLRAWMTAQGATSYDVVIYIDGDTSDGSRRPQYWLQNCTGPYSAWVPGSDLSTHVALRDAANFGSTFTYTQVPLTSTTGANASSGNYAIFTGLTNDSFLLRTEDSPYARSPINGLQIVPRMTAGDPPALIAPNSVTNYAGATNVFTAAVGGILPMTYQWMAGPIGSSTYTNVLDGNNIAGATTPTLTITNLQFANEADYVLVATGPYGTTTTTPASLKVVAALVTQPLFPASARLYPGGTARFSIQATGTQPLTYQWRKNGSAIAGATTNSLVLGPVSNADAANYDVVITTPYGSVSQSASLSLLAAPTANSFAATVLAKAPLAYWRLGEEWGATTAYDNWGSFNGTYGVASSLQQTGPTDPDFTGFENPNYSLGVTATANAWATVPALNLSTNAVTFVAWLYPDGSAGSQQPWAGIFMTRAGGTQAGFGFRGSANELGLTWNTNTTWQYSSGLSVPSDQWSMAALVIEPTKATIYLGNTNVGLISKSISLPLGSEAWAGVANIGNDPNDATANRAFKGSMDEVAVFKYSLSPADMLSLYAAGRARGVLPPVIAKNPASLTLYPGCTAQFTVEATGSGTLTYQWKKVMGGVTNSVANGGNISGATTATLTLSSVGTADVGDYFVVVANSAGFATSTAASLALATPTGKPYETAVIAAAPYAYWRLNEASGVTAFDNFGGHNGMYGSSATLGYAGPMTSDFSGFENNNTALATGNAMVESWVTAEDLNLNTNTVTITAWINPIGAQAAWSGLVFNRAGLTRAGLGFDAGGTNLVYNWNDNGLTYNFNS